MIRTLQWHLHRFAVDRARWMRPFSRVRHKRLLFLSHGNLISSGQVFPYYFYEKALSSRWDVEFRERPVEWLDRQVAPGETVDAVFFQTGFNLDADTLRGLTRKIRVVFPGAKLVYLDWFAPTDLRYAEALCDEIDLYVKKHVLRDRSQYGLATVGDTNLTDYYCRRYGIAEPVRCFRVPAGFFDKLMLGPNFCLTPGIVDAMAASLPLGGDRPIDIHARIAVKGSPWYAGMREEALDAVMQLRDFHVLAQGRSSYRRYMRELRRSKLCFSPFGYGEVCWRDFEAAVSGSVLVKPDMAHVVTEPDFYIPGETYVPVMWDFADLQARCAEYSGDPSLRRRLARQAFQVAREYVFGGGFIRHLETLMARVAMG